MQLTGRIETMRQVDEVYGGDQRLRVWLEEREVPHVLAVKRSSSLQTVTSSRSTWYRNGPGAPR
jgi:hypothetical protein